MGKQTEKTEGVKKQIWAYAGLLFVVFVWGAAPLVSAYLYRYYTATISTAVSSLISAISLLLISLPHLKKLNRAYFKIAVPTGVFNSIAAILQKIGLQYTTPTQYAFLENLSCVIVPVLLFFLIRKKPGVLTVVASLLCLAGSFILSGMDFSTNSISFGKGEILCALAGLFYGVNIAVTGTYAKDFYAPLYVMIQIGIHTVLSFATAFALHFIKIDGVPIEPIVFPWNIKLLLLMAVEALVSSTMCWVIRLNVMRRINASAVAVIMPCSAVVTGVLSVALGMDTLTLSFGLGAGISFLAALLSSISDITENGKTRTKKEENEEKTTASP